MPRREDEPLDRAHVWLFRSDAEWLKATYGESIGVAMAVRRIVRAFRNKVEARVGDKIDAEPQAPASLEDLGV